MMAEVVTVPDLSGDERVRVFRRAFTSMPEYAGMTVDAYAIISAHYIVICDTLLSPGDMRDVMSLIGDELQAGRQLLVVNSHADWDHCWGNHYVLNSASIIGHRLCRARILSAEARRELADFQSRYARFSDVVLTPPTITFTDGLTLSDDDLTLEMFSAPGHTPDHIAAWLPELSLLLAFDAIEFPLPLIDNEKGVGVMFATLERFRALRPQRVLSSHSDSNDPRLIECNLTYLREIEARSRMLLRNHHPTEEDLEQAPELIEFPFSEIATTIPTMIDTTFYSQAHADNIRAIIRWLLADRQL